MKHSLEQDRAKFALDRVLKYKTEPSLWQGSYLRTVKGLSAMILTCGLGQSAATLLAQSSAKEGKEPDQDKKAIKQLFNDIESWLCHRSLGTYYDEGKGNNLLQEIADGDMKKYLNAQAEALSLLVWLKKMAVANLSGPESGVSNESATV